MTPLEKVLAEIRRYEHALLDFSAREHRGGVELVIALKGPHAMHDYLVEMFVRTPQTRGTPS